MSAIIRAEPFMGWGHANVAMHGVQARGVLSQRSVQGKCLVMWMQEGALHAHDLTAPPGSGRQTSQPGRSLEHGSWQLQMAGESHHGRWRVEGDPSSERGRAGPCSWETTILSQM